MNDFRLWILLLKILEALDETTILDYQGRWFPHDLVLAN